MGYESQLARTDRVLESIGAEGAAGDGSEGPGDATANGSGDLDAERELRVLVITAERNELDQLVARRKISERVAGGVRAALDVDETTMRP
jgi:hypothetical protein